MLLRPPIENEKASPCWSSATDQKTPLGKEDDWRIAVQDIVHQFGQRPMANWPLISPGMLVFERPEEHREERQESEHVAWEARPTGAYRGVGAYVEELFRMANSPPLISERDSVILLSTNIVRL